MKKFIITCLIVMLLAMSGCKEQSTDPCAGILGESNLKRFYLDLIQFKKVEMDYNHKIYDENNNELFYIDVVIEESFNKILNLPSTGRVDEYIENKEIKRIVATEEHADFLSKYDTFVMHYYFETITYKEVIDGKEYTREAWYMDYICIPDGTLLAIEDNRIICYSGDYTYFYGIVRKDLLKVKFREYMTKEEFLEFYINLFDYYSNGYC